MDIPPRIASVSGLARAWPFVAALALVGCVRAPRAGVVDTARREFSSDAYCPLHRVVGERVVTVPQPPVAVAADAERLAMWREAVERRAQDVPRQTVAVRGCGEQATFACWTMAGRRPGRRGGWIEVPVGSVCIEEKPVPPG